MSETINYKEIQTGIKFNFRINGNYDNMYELAKLISRNEDRNQIIIDLINSIKNKKIVVLSNFLEQKILLSTRMSLNQNVIFMTFKEFTTYKEKYDTVILISGQIYFNFKEGIEYIEIFDESELTRIFKRLAI